MNREDVTQVVRVGILGPDKMKENRKLNFAAKGNNITVLFIYL